MAVILEYLSCKAQLASTGKDYLLPLLATTSTVTTTTIPSCYILILGTSVTTDEIGSSCVANINETMLQLSSTKLFHVYTEMRDSKEPEYVYKNT